MKKGILKHRKGFTIIEVALVLAIAGLIFLMVFIALPSLQRTQRDAERREDVDALLAAVKKYQTNNRGALPSDSDWTDSSSNFRTGYLPGFEDPTGTKYNFSLCDYSKNSNCSNLPNDNSEFKNNNYTMYVVKQAICNTEDGEGLIVGTNNPRRIAVLYVLEGPGVYCNNT